MTDLINLRTNQAKVATPLRSAELALFRKTIRQLNSIGIYDGATMKAVYARRLKAAEPQLAVAA